MEFKLISDFTPTGDQPEAIRQLTDGLKQGVPFQTLLGVTGSGKTFTIANVIEQLQRPVDVEPVFANIKHNKGFKRFNLKGKEKVEVETGLIAIAHNLKKMVA